MSGRCGRRGGRRMLALLTTVLAGTALALTVGAAPASAHDVLTGTTPAAGATVARTPSSVVLTFDQPAVAMGTQVLVTGPSGPVQSGPPRLVDATVSQDVQPGAVAGAYTVAWRVTSADGHPVSGTFTFTSSQPDVGTVPPATPSAAVPEAPAQVVRRVSWTGWSALGVAVLLLLVGVAVVLRRGARGTDQDSTEPDPADQDAEDADRS